LAIVKGTLKSLNLRYNAKVTDAGFKELACLENLEILFVPAVAAINRLQAVQTCGRIALLKCARG